jgi:hypothetical protein
VLLEYEYSNTSGIAASMLTTENANGVSDTPLHTLLYYGVYYQCADMRENIVIAVMRMRFFTLSYSV